MNKTIALVGRTNVGKSSIFNKLVKAKSSIVSSQEGLTRDMKTAELKYNNKTVQLVDTGGFYTSKDDYFEDNGLKIIVDKKSLFYLLGTELDFSDGLNGKGFQFNNPNANRTCGCGESFSL